MQSPREHSPEEPWYRNGWVWLIIAIPAATVVGCMLTIYVALANPDEIVKDPASEQPVKAEPVR